MNTRHTVNVRKPKDTDTIGYTDAGRNMGNGCDQRSLDPPSGFPRMCASPVAYTCHNTSISNLVIIFVNFCLILNIKCKNIKKKNILQDVLCQIT
jgi:hypothetical protein